MQQIANHRVIELAAMSGVGLLDACWSLEITWTCDGITIGIRLCECGSGVKNSRMPKKQKLQNLIFQIKERHSIFSFFEHPRKMGKSQIFNFSGHSNLELFAL